VPRKPNPYPTIHVRRRGAWYSLDIRHRGNRWWEATGTDRRAEADDLAERRRAELAGGDGLPVHDAAASKAHSVNEALASFLNEGTADVSRGTERMYRIKAGHIGRLLGSIDLADLSLEDVQRFVAARRPDACAHTIAKELVTLRRVLAFAEQRGHIGPGWRSLIPARFKSAYAPRDRWLTEDEFRALYAALPEKRRLWLLCAVFLGGRESELRALTWEAVDLRLGFVVIISAKTRHGSAPKKRHIPIAPALRRALEAIEERKRKGQLLAAWRNGALMVSRFAQKAGIVKAPVYERLPSKREGMTRRGKMLEPGGTLSPNDLRRTFASWMLQGGATVKEVADLMGHGTTAMVERIYGHLARENLVAAVNRLPNFATGMLPISPGEPAKPAISVARRSSGSRETPRETRLGH